ncbi:MAG: alpha-amylase family glycosyl hydrolase [Spirochaetia bacterium]|nr:alpha-amylase family glycosyl hydrolase [Spirochaetia bacterium]
MIDMCATVLACRLDKIEPSSEKASAGDRMQEFHVHASLREITGVDSALFMSSGNLVIPNFAAARNMAQTLRSLGSIRGQDTKTLSAGRLNAMGLVDEILHGVLRLYRERIDQEVLRRLMSAAGEAVGLTALDALLREFCLQFPPREVYSGHMSAEAWLSGSSAEGLGSPGVSNRQIAFEEMILLKLANENPAFACFRFLFDDGLRPMRDIPDSLAAKTLYAKVFAALDRKSLELPSFGPPGEEKSLLELLRMPAKAAPDSLEAQLRWIKEHWGARFETIGAKILSGLDLIAEEERPYFPPGPGPAKAYNYVFSREEYEKFTQDRDWMPSLVLLAKNALVWLHQLSITHNRPINRLDEIPDSELDAIASRGINGLWLIGIWQRSSASEKIKRLCGNPEAAASAYSLFDYEIAWELGGWEALDKLRERCLWRGIRLAADMVPNHTGLDSAWIRQRPDLFIGTDRCPFPNYSFNGPDLSEDPSIGLWIEDHYYSRSDAAVVFKRLNRNTGHVRYIYHGNDGTGMAWNDTAQIDFLNPEARAMVRERILHVAKHFSIIRFDAAMVLARQHIRRLWYPAPGSGGAIPSRSEYSLHEAEFNQAIPGEFWREVVDECAEKSPDTLLLAEAFWMMEGYFTRTLGMHRVYNSAFMNMLKEEKNSLYRLTVKNTQEFDKEILKRFVNFMSNPDEETAVAQFGIGDKYFGVCTMMATMPGLPMFGHGQIEGFTEKYGMEYRRSYRDEKPDLALIERHEKEIFPLLRRRRLFAGVEQFYLFDFISDEGHIDESVFAYSNGLDKDIALVFYNNCWQRSSGSIVSSCAYTEKDGSGVPHLRRKSLTQALGLDPGPRNYLAAQEQRSGLWYLYRCSDLNSYGWRVELQGYQSLVFSDFTRIHDLDGVYERLWISLMGRGVPNLDEAVEEATRPELYRALDSCTASLRRCGEALLAKGATESAVAIPPLVERLGSDAEHFFSRLALAISEDGGNEPSIEAPLHGRIVIENGIRLLGAILELQHPEDTFGPEQALLFSRLKALLSFPLALRACLDFVFIEGLSRVNQGANKTEELRYILEKFLIRKKILYPELTQAQKGDSAQKTEDFDAEQLQAAQAVDILGRLDTPALHSIVFAFATRPRDTSFSPPLGKGEEEPKQLNSAKARAAELVRWAAGDSEGRLAIGVNSWEGKDYFNKERFEALLELWPCFALIEAALDKVQTGVALKSGSAGHSRTDSGASTADLLDLLKDLSRIQAFEIQAIARKAQATSGYLMEALLVHIEHEEP